MKKFFPTNTISLNEKLIDKNYGYLDLCIWQIFFFPLKNEQNEPLTEVRICYWY